MTPTAQRRKKVSTGLRQKGQKSPVVVLVSGGIDSAVLLAFYLRERFHVRPCLWRDSSETQLIR